MSTLPEHSTYKKINPGGSGHPSGDNDPPSSLDAIATNNKDTNPSGPLLTSSGSIDDPAVSDALEQGHTIRANGTVFESGNPA